MAQAQKSVILKLRQEEATSNMGHGNYTINLKKPVLMSEGDVVKVHTAILDTSADGIVSVLDDGQGLGGTEVHLDIAVYNTWYEQRQNKVGNETIIRYPKPDPVGTSQDPTNTKYICCIGKGVPANTFKVETFTVYPAGGGFDMYGDCLLTFQYTSPMNGELVTKQKHFRGGHQISHLRGIAMDIGWNVEGNNGLTSFKCIDDHEYLREHKIDFRQWDNKSVKYSANPIAVGSVNLEPYEQRMTFVIREGRYTPGEISQLITDQVSLLNQEPSAPLENDPANNKFTVQNPFLTTIRQINHKTSQIVGAPFSNWFCPMRVPGATPAGQPIPAIDHVIQYPVNELETEANFAQPYDIFCGAEQVAMNFDPVLKKLNFDIMHFPIYIGWTGTPGTNNAVPGIKFMPAGQGGAPIKTYGGAMLTGMYPSHFWSKQLGFSDMIIDWQTQSTSFNTGPNAPNAGEDVFPVAVTPVVGKNITNVYDGLDTVVPHSDEFYVPNTTISVANSNTRPILAQREFDIALNDEGYFLIEIGFKFPQSMVGGQQANNKNSVMNNIQMIVGKYFTSDNNFVQDQGDGSITYEHVGEPQVLTDLQIRILNPDGSEPTETDLGVKNSIFLEVIKTLQLSA